LKEAVQLNLQQQQQILQQEKDRMDQRTLLCEGCKKSVCTGKTEKSGNESSAGKSTAVATKACAKRFKRTFQFWQFMLREKMWRMAKLAYDSATSFTTSVNDGCSNPSLSSTAGIPNPSFASSLELLADLTAYLEKNGAAEEDEPGSRRSSSDSNSACTAACDLLIMYIGNLLKNTSNPRYKRITTTNSSYLKALGSFRGHEEVLTSVGFQRKKDGMNVLFEYGWAPFKVLEAPGADASGVDKAAAVAVPAVGAGEFEEVGDEEAVDGRGTSTGVGTSSISSMKEGVVPVMEATAQVPVPTVLLSVGDAAGAAALAAGSLAEAEGVVVTSAAEAEAAQGILLAECVSLLTALKVGQVSLARALVTLLQQQRQPALSPAGQEQAVEAAAPAQVPIVAPVLMQTHIQGKGQGEEEMEAELPPGGS
jgi:hypothetical protein